MLNPMRFSYFVLKKIVKSEIILTTLLKSQRILVRDLLFDWISASLYLTKNLSLKDQ